MEINRRQFVVSTACAACAAALHCTGEKSDAETTSTKIDAGPLSQYSKPGASDALVRTHKIFLINQDNQLFAADAHCTHRNCILKIKGEGFACPCHGSIFTLYGTVDHGPAQYSLERYGISLSTDNHVMIDTSKQFREVDWDKPGAFIKIDK